MQWFFFFLLLPFIRWLVIRHSAAWNILNIALFFFCSYVFIEEQLECLAQWKDGSLRYLMGRLQHQGATSDEDRYRCFVYEKIQPPPPSTSSSLSPLLLPSTSSSTSAGERHNRQPTFLLAQSGDATCSGLTSPTEGSRTLKLTKGMRNARGVLLKRFLSKWKWIPGRIWWKRSRKMFVSSTTDMISFRNFSPFILILSAVDQVGGGFFFPFFLCWFPYRSQCSWADGGEANTKNPLQCRCLSLSVLFYFDMRSVFSWSPPKRKGKSSGA